VCATQYNGQLNSLDSSFPFQFRLVGEGRDEYRKRLILGLEIGEILMQGQGHTIKPETIRQSGSVVEFPALERILSTRLRAVAPVVRPQLPVPRY